MAKDFNTILSEAQQIKNEIIEGANTALRTGTCLEDIVQRAESDEGLAAKKARTITAGNGLTGGGSLATDMELAVGNTDDSIVVGADGIKVDTQDSLTSTSITKPLSAAKGKALQDTKANKTVIIEAGNGLTGGGDLSGNRTLNIESATDGITPNADNIQLNTIDALDSTSATKPLSAKQGKVLQDNKADKSRKVNAGLGLTGGGDLAADRTIDVVSANDGITVNADNIQLNTIDNVTSTSVTKPLSANQGKVLNDKVVQVETDLNANIDQVRADLNILDVTLNGIGPIQFTEGYAYMLGGVGTTLGTLNNISGWSYSEIDVTGVNVIHINSSSSSTNRYNGFVDENNIVLAVAKIYAEVDVTVPVGAKKLILNNNLTSLINPSAYVVDPPQELGLIQDFTNIQNSVNDVTEDIVTINNMIGGYQTTQIVFIQDKAYIAGLVGTQLGALSDMTVGLGWSYSEVNVEGVKTVHINAGSISDSRRIVFVDSSDIIVYSVKEQYNANIDVPNGSVRLIINNNTIKVTQPTIEIIDPSQGSGGLNYNVSQIHNANPLYMKKWAPVGDSFTEAINTGIIQEGKYKGEWNSYVYLIGNRNEMDIEKFFAGGRTMARPDDPAFTNTVLNYYQNIPVDVDYITLYIGINDRNHYQDGDALDVEDYTGIITLGTIDSVDENTFYGAWNVVIKWLIENRPYAKIGVLVSNGTGIVNPADHREELDNLRKAEIDICNKWGLPYIDLNGDERTPMMHRSSNPKFATEAKVARLLNFSINSTVEPYNYHPNEHAQRYMSTFIENFLRSI